MTAVPLVWKEGQTYNTRHKSWNTYVIFPFPSVDLGIAVISVLQNTRLKIGEGEAHIWVPKVWRVNVIWRKFEKNDSCFNDLWRVL